MTRTRRIHALDRKREISIGLSLILQVDDSQCNCACARFCNRSDAWELPNGDPVNHLELNLSRFEREWKLECCAGHFAVWCTQKGCRKPLVLCYRRIENRGVVSVDCESCILGIVFFRRNEVEGIID